MIAAESGATEIVRLLLTTSNVNAATSDGMTALMFAVQHISIEIVNVLLKAGSVADSCTKVN